MPACSRVGGWGHGFGLNQAQAWDPRETQAPLDATTRWSTTLPSEVNVSHAIVLGGLCGANLVTQPSEIRGAETLALHHVASNPTRQASTPSILHPEHQPRSDEAKNWRIHCTDHSRKTRIPEPNAEDHDKVEVGVPGRVSWGSWSRRGIRGCARRCPSWSPS